jgi:hypothetical protein
MFVHGAPPQRPYLWSECADWSHFGQLVEQLTCCAFGAQRSRVYGFFEAILSWSGISVGFWAVESYSFPSKCSELPVSGSVSNKPIVLLPFHASLSFMRPAEYIKIYSTVVSVDQKRGHCIPWNVDTFTTGQDILYSYGPQEFITVFIKSFPFTVLWATSFKATPSFYIHAHFNIIFITVARYSS